MAQVNHGSTLVADLSVIYSGFTVFCFITLVFQLKLDEMNEKQTSSFAAYCIRDI